ncbi:serine/threonine protein kinase [Stackebrandtia albiflava]|uniref:non-specific serine/threonine protein kinase n=1 Tax=Stackebrandtia albiflava TaxID=406432 RepID=A0A562V0S1_9ACTN|nr:protein kinase [Stackebrandtia albiflava]TWJ11478.1 serine/threonine protein kinase [Stackebrandtia albiflava]
MDDTTSSTFLPWSELTGLLPGYRLDQEPVSTTNMSRVYLAVDTRLHHRKVAIKIMADYLASHAGYRKRFLREIQLMAGLEHPNIAYIITAASEEDRLLYFVMPRAEADLRTRLKAGPLDLSETAHTVGQIAAALDHAHDHGVLHRDVKPGNILFGAGGHVYLSDFGVAKTRSGEDLTAVGETIGTRRYTAMEVFNGETTAPEPRTAGLLTPATAVERAGDVYSLGAVLYHCLTGRRPFDELDDIAAEAAQRDGGAPRVTESRPDLPETLDTVVAKAMHLDPAARYHTCEALASDLNRAIGRSGVGPVPASRGTTVTALGASDDTPPTVASSGRTAVSAPRRIGMIATMVAAVVVAFTAGLFVPDRDADGASGAETPTDPASSESPAAPDESAPPPVTGDEQVERYPMEGECLMEAEDYTVVACDSPEADEYVFKIVTDPEDPNPSQPDHDDAAWLACGGEGFDYHYYWRDSAIAVGREWDPETDRIYYFICYRNL